MNIRTFAIVGFVVTTLGILRQIFEGFIINTSGFNVEILTFLPPALFALIALVNKKLIPRIFKLGMLAIIIEVPMIVFPYVYNSYQGLIFQWINLILSVISIGLVVIALVKRIGNRR